jgi:hypothetical protein
MQLRLVLIICLYANTAQAFTERVYRCFVSSASQAKAVDHLSNMDIWKRGLREDQQYVDVRVRDLTEVRKVHSLFKRDQRAVLIPDLKQHIQSHLDEIFSAGNDLEHPDSFFDNYRVS